jgi:two-component system, NarL family, sensor histidine kinase DegS
MTSPLLNGLWAATKKAAKNPHFWVVVVLSTGLLFVYQVWPWSQWHFASGLWRSFGWLSGLQPVVLHVELKYHFFGVLFLIPVIYGSLTLGWAGGMFAWFLSLFWSVPTLLSWSNSVHWISLALLLLPVLLVAIVTGERRWREGDKRHFMEREQERKAYIAKLVETEETERRRIAQELHDETLQTLMVIANKSDSLALSAADPRQAQGNLWIKQELLHTMDDLRRLSMNLRPSILDNFGLVSGVRWLVNDSNNQNGCRTDVVVNGPERKMSSLSEVTAFRVVQEALNNIQKHARAKNGMVTLDFEEAALLLRIEDDGMGFEPPERLGAFVSESKLGVIGMEQRVVSIGGELRLESHPGLGTRVWASVPYVPSAQVVEGENA